MRGQAVEQGPRERRMAEDASAGSTPRQRSLRRPSPRTRPYWPLTRVKARRAPQTCGSSLGEGPGKPGGRSTRGARLISQRQAAGLADWTGCRPHHARRAASSAASMPPCVAVGSCIPLRGGWALSFSAGCAYERVCTQSPAGLPHDQERILRRELLPATSSQSPGGACRSHLCSGRYRYLTSCRSGLAIRPPQPRG